MRSPFTPTTVSVLARVALLGACALALATPAAAPAERSREPGPALTGVVKTGGLVYDRAIDSRGRLEALRLDLYQPALDAARSRPAFVWIHGGGFRAGTRAKPEIVDMATAFARRGYVSASIDYRLDPRGMDGRSVARVPAGAGVVADARRDAQAAVRWLRANAGRYRIDRRAIVVGGGSAGAIAALGVAFDPPRPGASRQLGHSSTVAAAVSLWGAFPARRVESGAPPIAMLHGTADKAVPHALAGATCRATRARGNVCSFTSLRGARHAPWARYRDAIVARTARFLCRVKICPR